MLISATTQPFQYPSELSKATIASKMGFKGDEKDRTQEIFGMSSKEFLSLNEQEQAKLGLRKTYPLTGYTRGDETKVSIIGKLKGYDPDFTKEQIADLKQFINYSKGLFVEHIQNLHVNSNNKPQLLRDRSYNLDEFIKEFATSMQHLPFLESSQTVSLLDSNLSIDEFKVKWSQYVLQERFGLTLKDDDASKAIDILNELQSEQELKDTNKAEQNEKFKPLEVIRGSQTYKDEAINELQKFYELVKREFDSGKNTFDILEFVAKNRIDVKV
ncbi:MULTISPECIES: hypothetical protein [unclassified Campylobacter]|uniref:hypothetical protein n=1 Tax=unclassified Campylobacter TaxID=2593542 RepID=UPI003D33EDD3